MAPPMKSTANPTQRHGSGADPPRENPPSNNLWIGNVSPDVTEAELKALLEKYGKVDSLTVYSSRNYAFVYFKEVEAAKSARQGLQGHVLRGNSLKIEFARPAKPCKSLWVAGISQTISKEDLEKEFLKFGKIQEFRFLRDRNTAYVDYFGLEDATQALKVMNGRWIGGAQLRVDFLRSHSSRREQGPDAKEGQFTSRNIVPSDLHWMGQDSMNNYPEPGLSGSRRKNQFLPIGSQYGEALPTNVLWISHPPNVIVEEDMLHNAMILFGEIERITTFTDRNYAFVEFRSVEEARRAKEGLEGKLFNDPRISIEYASTDFPGARGQAGIHPFHPVQMDIHGLNRPVLLGNHPGHLPTGGIRGPDLYTRPPMGPHSTFEPLKPGSQTLVGGSTWRRSSPTPGILSSPSAGFNIPNRSAPGAWDVFDGSQHQRETKRSRLDAALTSERTEHQAGTGEQYGLHSLSSSGASGSLTRGTGAGRSGSLTRGTAGVIGQRHAESDCIWRGLIAKGGTPVCHARCVPIGEGLGVDIPDVVNCSARTGLDLLSKHYDEAIGFSIVFFLPDSEDDFASYTEFLRYLGSKDRAGVAKFDNGTTLFLVPPSDFLTNVLKISGPARLYGVVLKFPQAIGSSPALNLRSIHPQYADPYKMNASQTGYGAIPPKEKVLPMDNSRVFPEDLKLLPKAPVPMISSFPAQSAPPTTMASQTGSIFTAQSAPPTTMASQSGLTLTPELIATLSSLLPANNGPSGSQTSSLPQASSILGAPNVANAPDTNIAYWNRGQQAVDHNGQLVQQLGSQINSQLQHLQAGQAAPVGSNMSFHQTLNSYSQVNDRTTSLTPHDAALSRPMVPVVPLQSGPVPVAPEMNRHYQQGSSQDVSRGQGIDNRIDAQKFYNSSIIQQPSYPVALPNQMHANTVSTPQSYMPVPSEVEQTKQTQPLQTFGVSQESETDKNERYKTTLLFAANLLSRIHQPGNQSGQGDGSQ